MDDFLKSVEEGLAGKKKGLPGGLPRFDKKTYNVQLGKIHTIVASEKAGKTFFAVWRYILVPWMAGHRDIKWTYYSLEVDREQLLARIVSYFVYAKFNIKVPYYRIMGYGDERLNSEEEVLVRQTYAEEIPKLLEYLDIVCDNTNSNPTGIYKKALNDAAEEGEFKYEDYFILDANEDNLNEGKKIKKTKISSYIPKDPEKKRMIIIDTLKLMKKERGFDTKANIDKWMEDYAITLRNVCKYTIVNVHHLNRNIVTVERKKYSKNNIQPESGDVMDTSSIAQGSDQLIGIFNPSLYVELDDDHMGYKYLAFNGMYRSVHVIANRFGMMPVNTAVLLDFEAGCFTELPLATDKVALEAIKKQINA